MSSSDPQSPDAPFPTEHASESALTYGIDTLTRLFQSRYGLVVGAAGKFARRSDYVDDVVQQVYVEFVSRGLEGRWDLEKDVGPLLYQIAKRKGQDYWREQQKRRGPCLDAVIERLGRESAQHPLDDYETEQDELRALRACLEKLPPKSRAIIEQRYFKGVSAAEIAEQQDKKASTLHQFLYKIRFQLRLCIERTTGKGTGDS